MEAYVPMNPETLTAVQTMIERLGLPIFVALCALVLFAAVFRYMTNAIERKDTDIRGMVNDHNGRVDSIIENHNMVIGEITANFSATVEKNTTAIDGLRQALQTRTDYIAEQTRTLETLVHDNQK
jgi:hypothetical protein